MVNSAGSDINDSFGQQRIGDYFGPWPAAAWMITLVNNGSMTSAGDGIDSLFVGRQQQYYGGVGLAGGDAGSRLCYE